ncbi:uncharacterized protein [Onthophagus taurus]|uniref:uncharacterized protein n=1 Tax=Onthophagus taurus TaxID=166361 RepID=UPI0039BDBF16
MAARIGLTVIISTFRRTGSGETIPDVTLASENMAGRILDWSVLEEYTGSDHQYIKFHIADQHARLSMPKSTIIRWNIAKLNVKAFTEAIENGKAEALKMRDGAELVTSLTMSLVRQACDLSMPGKRPSTVNKKSAYWWMAEIAKLRKQCNQQRRKLTRVRRRDHLNALNDSSELKAAKKELKRAIAKSKHQKWEKFRDDINRDPWGLGYKLVMKKRRKIFSPTVLTNEETSTIVADLFPECNENVTRTSEEVTDLPVITEPELLAAAKRSKIERPLVPTGSPLKF